MIILGKILITMQKSIYAGLFISCLFFLFTIKQSVAQSKIVSSTLMASYTSAELKDTWKKNKVPEFIIPINHGVDVYDVIYMTEWHDGTPIKASGLYYVPIGATKPMATLIYHHGTRIEKGRNKKLGGENAICVAFATDGYAVLMPDYIGLGHGEKFHLYQHADSEAQASIDFLKASKLLNPKIGIETNDHLFLTGYSQGGHSAMATHKELEASYKIQFPVTASAPMSGAYDMSGVQSEVMFKPYDEPHYLPYLLKGYNEVYEIVPKETFYEIFKPPYDTLIPKLFDGKHNRGQVNKALPKIPTEMVVDDMVKEYVENPQYKFTLALKENDLYNWKPEAPVQMCYCNADEQVTYKNALVAEKQMKALGAKNVKALRAGKKYGHQKCALFAAIYTKMYFDSFRKGHKNGKKGPILHRLLIGLSKLKVKA